MKKQGVLFFIILLLAVALPVYPLVSGVLSGNSHWKAHNGVIDLRNWDPEKEGPIQLGGVEILPQSACATFILS
uniref:Uncharacterized protein n=1 Tax=Paenibacillus polymyxa TaxID=1406 RepID=A0AAE9Q0R9_PAEPO